MNELGFNGTFSTVRLYRRRKNPLTQSWTWIRSIHGSVGSGHNFFQVLVDWVASVPFTNSAKTGLALFKKI